MDRDFVKGIIRRELDNLTKEEIKTHWKAVEAAMFDELKRWYDLKTFRRKPKRQSTNIVDGTWVLRWKKIPITNSTTGETNHIKIVKARLTARGFKDYHAYDENIHLQRHRI